MLVLLVLRIGWLKGEERRLFALEQTLDKLNFCETAKKHCMERDRERAMLCVGLVTAPSAFKVIRRSDKRAR